MALIALGALFGGFALGTVFGWCVATLRRPWYRPLSAAARAVLAQHAGRAV